MSREMFEMERRRRISEAMKIENPLMRTAALDQFATQGSFPHPYFDLSEETRKELRNLTEKARQG